MGVMRMDNVGIVVEDQYALAGASGFFVPGLVDAQVIATLCEKVELPINVMMSPGLPETSALARIGVARVSYGPAAYLNAMDAVRVAASKFPVHVNPSRKRNIQLTPVAAREKRCGKPLCA